MTTTTETSANAAAFLDRSSASGRPLWSHHECYEPALRAMAEAGSAVHVGPKDLGRDGVELRDHIRRNDHDCVLWGYWRREALLPRLEQVAWRVQRDGELFGYADGARHADDIRAFAATL